MFSLVLLVLAGCGSGDTDDQSAARPSGSAGDSPPDTQPLVIYTYDSFPEPLEIMIREHLAEDPGVDMTMERFQDTGGLYNQVWLEREDPEADVVIGLDTTYMSAALETGLFVSYRPTGADGIRNDLIVDPEFRLTPYDWGHVVLNYDSELLPDAPTSWDELLDPRLEDSIILLNPATSSPGRAFLQHTVLRFGEDGFTGFWQALKPNVLTVTSGWSDGYGLYVEGEAPIVLSYETSPAYHIAFEDTTRYKNLILDDEGYAQIELAGIIESTSNPEASRAVIDFLVTNAFQSELPLNQFMYPVVTGVELPEVFSQLDRAQETVYIPVEQADDGFAAWLSRWQAIMQ